MTIEGMNATKMVDVMVKFQISPKQFLLLLILETDKREEKGQIVGNQKNAIQNVYRIAEHLEAWSFEEIDDLIEKELLINNTPAGAKRDAYPDNYEVSTLFITAIMSSMDDFEEFWETYPSFVDNFDRANGPKIPLKAADYDALEKDYRRLVKTKAMHRQVMDTLVWAKENNQINMSIAKYVASRMWVQQTELRLSKRSTSMNQLNRLIR